MNKRVFIAVNLPNEIKKTIFENFSLKIPKNECKIVKEENLHITLKFLGYLSEEKIGEIKEKMKELKNFEAFKIKLNKIGSFGNRVIWIGIKEGSKELKELSEKLNALLELSDEKFHAHITIARNKKLNAKQVKELIEKLNKEKSHYQRCASVSTVETVDLMESKLSSAGPNYSTIFKVKFK